MLEVTEQQQERITEAEMSVNDCMEAYREAISNFNDAVNNEFDLVQEAADAFAEALEKAEEVRKSVARSVRRKLNKLSKESLDSLEGAKAIRWVEEWETMVLDPVDGPEPPSELEGPDFGSTEFEKFANIPFASEKLS